MQTPIISAAELRKLMGLGSLRIVDVRKSPLAYQGGHIPGAIYFDLEKDLSATTGPGRHPLPRAEEFVETLSTAGIGDSNGVVCYDDMGGAYAARLWWMLDDLGMDSVAVLDGGLQAWQDAGYSLEESVASYPRASWKAPQARNRRVDRDELLAAQQAFLVLDARASERYRGEVEPLDPVAGHIPGALSAPFADNLSGGNFQSPDALRARFEALGVSSAEAVVNSCGSGVTACHNILALRLAGFGRTALYPGSWSDWCNSGLAIATGEGPSK